MSRGWHSYSTIVPEKQTAEGLFSNRRNPKRTDYSGQETSVFTLKSTSTVTASKSVVGPTKEIYLTNPMHVLYISNLACGIGMGRISFSNNPIPLTKSKLSSGCVVQSNSEPESHTDCFAALTAPGRTSATNCIWKRAPSECVLTESMSLLGRSQTHNTLPMAKHPRRVIHLHSRSL